MSSAQRAEPRPPPSPGPAFDPREPPLPSRSRAASSLRSREVSIDGSFLDRAEARLRQPPGHETRVPVQSLVSSLVQRCRTASAAKFQTSVRSPKTSVARPKPCSVDLQVTRGFGRRQPPPSSRSPTSSVARSRDPGAGPVIGGVLGPAMPDIARDRRPGRSPFANSALRPTCPLRPAQPHARLPERSEPVRLEPANRRPALGAERVPPVPRTASHARRDPRDTRRTLPPIACSHSSASSSAKHRLHISSRALTRTRGEPRSHANAHSVGSKAEHAAATSK